jgi:hypothetical protein
MFDTYLEVEDELMQRLINRKNRTITFLNNYSDSFFEHIFKNELDKTLAPSIALLEKNEGNFKQAKALFVKNLNKMMFPWIVQYDEAMNEFNENSFDALNNLKKTLTNEQDLIRLEKFYENQHMSDSLCVLAEIQKPLVKMEKLGNMIFSKTAFKVFLKHNPDMAHVIKVSNSISTFEFNGITFSKNELVEMVNEYETENQKSVPAL